MGLKSFYKSMMRGNYELGRNLTNMMTRKMNPDNARRITGVIDAVAGAGLTYFFGLSTLSYIAAGATAAISILTAPATIPAAALTLGISVLFAGMGALVTGIGVGFLSSAKEKLPSPKQAVIGTGHAVGAGARAVAKPFKWTARKLRHPFKKAHDDGKPQAPKPPSEDPGQWRRPKPGHHSL